MNQNSTDESNDFGDAGHALRAMEPVLALAATRTGGDQL